MTSSCCSWRRFPNCLQKTTRAHYYIWRIAGDRDGIVTKAHGDLNCLDMNWYTSTSSLPNSIQIILGKMSSLEALKCLNWLPLAGRRLFHRCTTVENAIKGDIPQHLESFKSTLRSLHGYNTRNGYLPRLPKPKTECGKRVSYLRFTNDWMSLPVF